MWFGVEVHCSEAELVVGMVGRGEVGGHDEWRQWRRLSLVAVCERNGGGESVRGKERESQTALGVAWHAKGVQADEGAARQAAAGVARRGVVAVFSSAFWQEEEDEDVEGVAVLPSSRGSVR